MKILGLREARDTLSETLQLAQDERVVITSHGRPVALLIGLQGVDLEDVLIGSDADFWKMIQERRKEKAIPWADARQKLGLAPGKKTRTARGTRGK
jgi:prevent-host-death family protein